MTALLGLSVILALAGIGAVRVFWVLLRCHRHAYFLHSYDTGPLNEPLTGRRQGQWITACLECSQCGKRKLVERGAMVRKAQQLASKEEALVWLRSQCSPAPSHLPEQIEEPSQGET